VLFVVGSLLSKPSLDEITASQAAIEQTSFALSAPYTARSARPYLYSMQEVLGVKVAEQEMSRALEETGLDIDETRAPELRVLHERLERNMSGLIGPTLARTIVRQTRPSADAEALGQDTRLLEMRLEASREQMRGMTKQLDDLRRYLRDVLHELPLGACSISASGTIYLWNSAMQSITGITERAAQGSSIADLPSPWNNLLGEFTNSTENHRFDCPVTATNNRVSVNLHKADIGTPANTDAAFAGQVILMEDRTEYDTLEAELAHSERLASVGRLAAGVAHEIGNPLTGIASIAQNMAHDAIHAQNELSQSDKNRSNLNELDNTGANNAEQEIGEQASDILNQVSRINSIVRSLLTFSHEDKIAGRAFENVPIAQCIHEALHLVQLASDTKAFAFDVNVPEHVHVFADSTQLVQVFVNLINNACDASPGNGYITIDGEIDRQQLNITVTDSGPGIDPAVQDQIFEPFFTTKSVGSGTGLGLSLVYSIVNKHGGRVRVDEQYQDGTRMIVTLPIADATDVGVSQ